MHGTLALMLRASLANKQRLVPQGRRGEAEEGLESSIAFTRLLRGCTQAEHPDFSFLLPDLPLLPPPPVAKSRSLQQMSFVCPFEELSCLRVVDICGCSGFPQTCNFACAKVGTSACGAAGGSSGSRHQMPAPKVHLLHLAAPGLSCKKKKKN